MKWLEAKKAAGSKAGGKTARVGWGKVGRGEEKEGGRKEGRRGGGGRGGKGGGGRGGEGGGEEGRELVEFFSSGETEKSVDDLDDGSDATAKLKVSQTVYCVQLGSMMSRGRLK